MDIALFHKHYNPEHLEEVKAKMLVLGAPVIKAAWSEMYGCWLAIEGCHRIRAAKALGLTPVINDISNSKRVSVQIDGRSVQKSVSKLIAELEEDAWRTEVISFRS